MAKSNTIRLILILVVLLLIYSGIEFFGSNERSSNFRTSLVEIDTAKVTKVVFTKNSEVTDLVKEENAWKVKLSKGGYASAEKSAVKNTLNNLLTIKPGRIAARKKEKWSEYQVDTAGTRVEVFEGDNKTLDLVVGRFGVKGQNQFYTFVRLSDEDEVYVADNFMSFSVNQEANAYRNQKFVEFTKDSLQEIAFRYPADSAFSLKRTIDDQWVVGEQQTDSTATAQYLNRVRYKNSRQFVDDVEGQLSDPAYSISFKLRGSDDIVLDFYPHPEHNWVLRSSVNPEAYFADEQLVKDIAVSRETLTSSEEGG